MSSPDKEHLVAQERALLGQAHRTDRSHETRRSAAEKAAEIHEQRTGKPAPYDPEEECLKGAKSPTKGRGGGRRGSGGTHEERQERAFIAAAHRETRDYKDRIASAEKAAEIHRQRTGEDPDWTPEELVKQGKQGRS